jgi:hypothetical protein
VIDKFDQITSVASLNPVAGSCARDYKQFAENDIGKKKGGGVN